jgi:HKD family nuclease
MLRAPFDFAVLLVRPWALPEPGQHGAVFHQGQSGLVFVGSSNSSRHGLTKGLEWNLGVAGRDAHDQVRDADAAIARLFARPNVKRLTREWIDEYEQRAPVPAAPDRRVAAD